MEDKRTFSELGRIEAIRQLFEGTGYTPFGEPLWVETHAGDIVTTVSKTFLEGTDFNLVYFPLKHLGYKCVLEVVGELYAVMSEPQTLSVTLSVSAKLDFDRISELWGGIVAAAKEFSVKNLSLELQPSRNGLAVTMAAGGIDVKGAKRSKAESKDLICVSGSLGSAYFGMQLLEKQKSRDELEKHRMIVADYLKPELQAGLPSVFVESGIEPSFGYFVGNGLADAALRLGRDSGFGVKIYADRIPFEGGSFDLGKEMDIDPVSAAMNGGKDCRLLFTIPISQYEKFRKDFQTFNIVGHLALPEVGTVLVTPEGVELPISAQGW